MTPAAKCPKLVKLATACNDGACNPTALIIAFGEAVKELEFIEVRDHPAVKVILGQLSYLCHESTGPTIGALNEFNTWLTTTS